MSMTLKKIKNILESQYAMLVYFAFALVCWFFKSTNLVVIGSAVFLVVTLLLCSDVKNVFAPLIYISFFMESIFASANWVIYGIAIGSAVASFVFYMVKSIRANRGNIKKGKMFWAYLFMIVAFLIGGAFYKFLILEKLAFCGIATVAYILYFIVVNFCHDTKRFFLKLITFGAIVLSIERLVQLLGSDDVLDAIINRRYITLGTQNINAASLFIALGVPASFGLAYKNNHDYMYFGISLFLVISTCLTFCRANILLAVLFFVVLSILSFVKSQNKIEYAIVISIFSLLMFAFSKQISILIGSVIAKFGKGLNGREVLWNWCFDMFKSHPWFGVGFIHSERVPGLISTFPMILAHNTVLQYLTSVGVIGSLFMAYFYYKKYRVCFAKPFRQNKFVVFVILFIEISGMVDQAATMDAFIFLLNALLVGTVESYSMQFAGEQVRETLLRGIMMQNNLSCNEIRKHETGFSFTNDVYFVDDCVVKLSKSVDRAERLRKEIDFYKNVSLKNMPKLIASGREGDNDYLVIEKLKGNNLFHVWHSLSEDEQIDVIKQIADILNELHEKKGDFLEDKYIQTEWLKKWQKSFDKNIELLEKYGVETGAMRDFRDNRLEKVFAKNTCGLVLNDAHFDNFILNDGKIYVIDFDRVLYAPIDYELLVIKQMLSNPKEYANKFDKTNVQYEDYNFIYGLLKQYSPKMFESEYLTERVAVYELMLVLSRCYDDNNKKAMKQAIEKFEAEIKND